MKNIVIYYSRKGSNDFLAHKIASTLSCDIEKIRPRCNMFMLIMLNIGFGNKKIKATLSEYDRVIMVGPIFVGRFITPMKSFVKKYKNQIKKLVFVTCCGSTYEKKDEKFGHGIVFKELESILNGKCEFCQALPIDLLLPEELKEDTDAFMKTHLNETTFKGEIVEIYDNMITKLK